MRLPNPYWAPSFWRDLSLLVVLTAIGMATHFFGSHANYPNSWIWYLGSIWMVGIGRWAFLLNRLRLAHKLLRPEYHQGFMEQMNQHAFRAWLRNDAHAEFVGSANLGGSPQLTRKEQLTLALLLLRFTALTDPWYKPHNLRLRAKYIAGRIADMFP